MQSELMASLVRERCAGQGVRHEDRSGSVNCENEILLARVAFSLTQLGNKIIDDMYTCHLGLKYAAARGHESQD